MICLSERCFSPVACEGFGYCRQQNFIVRKPAPNVTLYLGDSERIVPTLTDHIDAVISDPPYGMKNNTDSRRFSGGHPEFQDRRKSQRNNQWAEVIGDDRPFDPSPWLKFPKVLLWGSNHYSAKLPTGTTLVWIKKNEDAYGTFLSDAEIAWMKGGYGVYCRKDLSFRANMKERKHPNEKPIGLMEWCIEKCGDIETVLDPYMGSGSTAVAAIKRGKKFIGIEIQPSFFAAAHQRILLALKQPKESRK